MLVPDLQKHVEDLAKQQAETRPRIGRPANAPPLPPEPVAEPIVPLMGSNN